MKRTTLGLAAIAFGFSAAASADNTDSICAAQEAAAPELIDARDDGVPLDEVIGEIQANASHDASANVLSESTEALYEDNSLGTEEAASMIRERCENALG